MCVLLESEQVQDCVSRRMQEVSDGRIVCDAHMYFMTRFVWFCFFFFFHGKLWALMTELSVGFIYNAGELRKRVGIHTSVWYRLTITARNSLPVSSHLADNIQMLMVICPTDWKYILLVDTVKNINIAGIPNVGFFFSISNMLSVASAK